MIIATERAGRPAEAVVPDHWRPVFEATGVPAAIRVDGTVVLSGHDGEEADGSYSPDLPTQIRRTFASMQATLAEAGATWDDVVELRSFHVGLQAQNEPLLAVAREFLTMPFPAGTAVGIAELYEDGAVVEIACTALLRAGQTPPAT